MLCETWTAARLEHRQYVSGQILALELEEKEHLVESR